MRTRKNSTWTSNMGNTKFQTLIDFEVEHFWKQNPDFGIFDFEYLCKRVFIFSSQQLVWSKKAFPCTTVWSKKAFPCTTVWSKKAFLCSTICSF